MAEGRVRGDFRTRATPPHPTLSLKGRGNKGTWLKGLPRPLAHRRLGLLPARPLGPRAERSREVVAGSEGRDRLLGGPNVCPVPRSADEKRVGRADLLFRAYFQARGARQAKIQVPQLPVEVLEDQEPVPARAKVGRPVLPHADVLARDGLQLLAVQPVPAPPGAEGDRLFARRMEIRHSGHAGVRVEAVAARCEGHERVDVLAGRIARGPGAETADGRDLVLVKMRDRARRQTAPVPGMGEAHGRRPAAVVEVRPGPAERPGPRVDEFRRVQGKRHRARVRPVGGRPDRAPLVVRNDHQPATVAVLDAEVRPEAADAPVGVERVAAVAVHEDREDVLAGAEDARQVPGVVLGELHVEPRGPVAERAAVHHEPVTRVGEEAQGRGRRPVPQDERAAKEDPPVASAAVGIGPDECGSLARQSWCVPFAGHRHAGPPTLACLAGRSSACSGRRQSS